MKAACSFNPCQYIPFPQPELADENPFPHHSHRHSKRRRFQLATHVALNVAFSSNRPTGTAEEVSSSSSQPSAAGAKQSPPPPSSSQSYKTTSNTFFGRSLLPAPTTTNEILFPRQPTLRTLLPAPAPEPAQANNLPCNAQPMLMMVCWSLRLIKTRMLCLMSRN